MKRFWKDARPVAEASGWGIQLDGRPLRTPARAEMRLPHERLAGAIAEEWSAAGETVDPRAMPLTGLANAAIDRVAPDAPAFAANLARYGEADLLYYRAQGPQALVRWQNDQWNPLLAWAGRRFDIHFEITSGLTHVPQPAQTVARLTQAVAALDPYRLAALSPIVTIGGSLIAGLALVDSAFELSQLWQAVSVDERWQIEQWGDDVEAVASLANRQRDFEAAAHFLTLLD